MSIYTEEEAKRKWCPFSRAIASYGEGTYGTSNRDCGSMNGDATACIASSCMAWQWLMIADSVRGAVLKNDMSLEWSAQTPRGFCGLARLRR